MEIRIDGTPHTLGGNSTVRQALRACGFNPETVLVSRNGEIIHENEVLRDRDELTLIKVISGG